MLSTDVGTAGGHSNRRYPFLSDPKKRARSFHSRKRTILRQAAKLALRTGAAVSLAIISPDTGNGALFNSHGPGGADGWLQQEEATIDHVYGGIALSESTVFKTPTLTDLADRKDGTAALSAVEQVDDALAAVGVAAVPKAALLAAALPYVGKEDGSSAAFVMSTLQDCLSVAVTQATQRLVAGPVETVETLMVEG